MSEPIFFCGPGCCDGCQDCYGMSLGCHQDPCRCQLPCTCRWADEHMLEVTVPAGYRIMLGTNSDVYLSPIRSFLDAPYDDAYAWLHGFYGIGNRFEWRLAGPAVMEKPEGFLWAAVWPDLQSLVDDLVQTWEDNDE